MAAQRLDKIIASTGRWSRREVKDLVRQGRVTVDGVPARSAEEKADPEQAVIAVNGELLNWRRYTWVMLNKPAGYLSATEDGRGATVLDLLPQDLQRQGLFPVGRLDKDTKMPLFFLVFVQNNCSGNGVPAFCWNVPRDARHTIRASALPCRISAREHSVPCGKRQSWTIPIQATASCTFIPTRKTMNPPRLAQS